MVDRINEEISYKKFISLYMSQNKPCLFTKWITSNWNSINDWVKYEQPNWKFLHDNFGNAMVPVEQSNTSYNNSASKQILFKDFLNIIQNNDTVNCPYLKDWHFNRSFPNYKAYETPTYFCNDWLNEFWQDQSDDYKFVYFGPKNSWTGLHADVLRSNSWSANVCGRKLWYLFKPGDELKLGVDVADVSGLVDDGSLAGNAARCGRDASSAHETGDVVLVGCRVAGVAGTVDCLVVVQEAGEVIFVPSGWFHQVHNLEDTISINHNWMNGWCIERCWSYLKHRHEEVVQEIEQHQNTMNDFELHCQLILRADTSMNYFDFFNFLHRISSNRFSKIQQQQQQQQRCSTEVSATSSPPPPCHQPSNRRLVVNDNDMSMSNNGRAPVVTDEGGDDGVSSLTVDNVDGGGGGGGGCNNGLPTDRIDKLFKEGDGRQPSAVRSIFNRPTNRERKRPTTAVAAAAAAASSSSPIRRPIGRTRAYRLFNDEAADDERLDNGTTSNDGLFNKASEDDGLFNKAWRDDGRLNGCDACVDLGRVGRIIIEMATDRDVARVFSLDSGSLRCSPVLFLEQIDRYFELHRCRCG